MLAAARHGNGVVHHAKGLDLGHRGAVHRGHMHVIAGALRRQRHRHPVRHEERGVIDDEHQAAAGAHAWTPEIRRHTAR
ncbi:hypothetical protein G6F65_022581 [Rhizopus arrhizus]|nr:hypothetical protein G6F65_022581 [Rhizopus arrhizus]